MIRPSRRYVLPAVLLLGVAALPTVLAALHPRYQDPCADPSGLRRLETIPGTRMDAERVGELSHERIQWSHGAILDEAGEPTPLRFDLIRDFASERFFVRPFAASIPALEPDAQRSARIETNAGPIEIHRALDGTARYMHGVERMVSWTFLYGNEPVESPLRARLLHVAEELYRGRRPLTVILVSGDLPSRRREIFLERSDAWMRDAVEHYVGVCGGPS